MNKFLLINIIIKCVSLSLILHVFCISIINMSLSVSDQSGRLHSYYKSINTTLYYYKCINATLYYYKCISVTILLYIYKCDSSIIFLSEQVHFNYLISIWLLICAKNIFLFSNSLFNSFFIVAS